MLFDILALTPVVFVNPGLEHPLLKMLVFCSDETGRRAALAIGSQNEVL